MRSGLTAALADSRTIRYFIGELAIENLRRASRITRDEALTGTMKGTVYRHGSRATRLTVMLGGHRNPRFPARHVSFGMNFGICTCG